MGTTRTCYECGFKSTRGGHFTDAGDGLFHCRALGPCERRCAAARRAYKAALRAPLLAPVSKPPGSLFERTQSGCLVWRGARNKAGYGYVRTGARVVYVHRMTFEAAYGPIPASMEVCHRNEYPICSRACAEPTHLWLGTHADNLRDMQLKGRAVGPLAKVNLTTSPLFETARVAVEAPAWVGAPLPETVNAAADDAPADPDWMDRMVPRYLALGEKRPDAIARALGVPVTSVREALVRVSSTRSST